jgi:hypothetical protein
MNREFSPEERLLRLIKGRKKQGDEKSSENKLQDNSNLSDNIIPVPVSPDSDNIKDKNAPLISGIKENPHNLKPGGFLLKPNISISPSYAVIAIVLILVPVVLYFIFNLVVAKDDQEVENLKKLIAAISEIKPPDMPLEEGRKPVAPAPDRPADSFDDYQKLINAKPIFAPPAVETRKAVAPEGPGLSDLIRDLRLVGVMPGDIPQVIIEDKKNNQTLFLREGEMINDIEIKSISGGRVVLARNDETVTLSL